MSTCYIKTLIEVDGRHYYINATDEVEYLKYEHQHFYKMLVEIQVFHDDRELELHMFRRWLRNLYGDQQVDFGAKSCEMIARELHGKIASVYPYRAMTIEISEDGICGVMLQFNAGET